MKRIIPALLLLLALDASAQLKKIDRATSNLQGPVKSTTTVYFRATEKFGELVKDYKEFTETHEYNKEGLLTSSKTVTNSWVTRISYKYDNAGNLIEKKEEDDDETILMQAVYSADNMQAEVNTFNKAGKLETKLKHKYNDQGLLACSSLYNGDGTLREKEEFTYDKNKHLIKQRTPDAKGNETKSVECEYDKDGRISVKQSVAREKNDITMSVFDYVYDEKGRVISITESTDKGVKIETTKAYDPHGNVTEEIINKTNYTKDVNAYDNRNNIVSLTRAVNFAGIKRKYIIEKTIKYY